MDVDHRFFFLGYRTFIVWVSFVSQLKLRVWLLNSFFLFNYRFVMSLILFLSCL